MSPVTKTYSICIALTVMLLCGFVGWVVDVNSTFLLGEFKKGDHKILDTPEGKEKWYSKYTDLIMADLKKYIYGTKQATKYF